MFRWLCLHRRASWYIWSKLFSKGFEDKSVTCGSNDANSAPDDKKRWKGTLSYKRRRKLRCENHYEVYYDNMNIKQELLNLNKYICLYIVIVYHCWTVDKCGIFAKRRNCFCICLCKLLLLFLWSFNWIQILFKNFLIVGRKFFQFDKLRSKKI